MKESEMFCTFTHCCNGSFWFKREDGASVEAYNWETRHSEYNAKETFKSIADSSDCYTVIKNGEIIQSHGW